MTKYAKKIAASDNVVTAVSDISAGETVTVKFQGEKTEYACNQNVPFGHKVAIQNIASGEKILKYGEEIGSATVDIKKGDWVHIHNVRDDYKCLDKDGNPLPGQED